MKVSSILIGLYRLAVEILLAAVGIPFFSLVFLVGIIYTLIKHLIKLDYSLLKQVVPLLRSITLSFDGLACAGAGELLNDATGVPVKYGKWYSTISAISGINHLFRCRDTWIRRFADFVLGRRHCELAVTEEQRFYYENKGQG